MDRALLERFAQAPNYRDFLRIAVENAGGVAAFSRRAQFTSRSFLSEVLRGNRRLSHASYEKVWRTLKLPGDLKQIFQLLVASEEPDVVALPGRREPEAQLKEVRAKVLQLPVQDELRNLISSPNVPVVYAALGAKGKGASLDEIVRRARIDRSAATHALQFLNERKLIHEEDGRYFAEVGDIDLDGLGGELGFRRSYAAIAETMKKLVMTAKASPENLFYYTAFPIAESQLDSFKREFLELLISHIERYQADEGDRVVRLNLGYFS